MKVIVYHGGYGCDTGCCGHWVEVKYDDGTARERFDFDHKPNSMEARAYAEKLVREAFGEQHVADLDWENCKVVDYAGCDY